MATPTTTDLLGLEVDGDVGTVQESGPAADVPAETKREVSETKNEEAKDVANVNDSGVEQGENGTNKPTLAAATTQNKDAAKSMDLIDMDEPIAQPEANGSSPVSNVGVIEPTAKLNGNAESQEDPKQEQHIPAKTAEVIEQLKMIRVVQDEKLASAEKEVTRLKTLIEDRENQLLKAMKDNARMNDALSDMQVAEKSSTPAISPEEQAAQNAKLVAEAVKKVKTEMNTEIKKRDDEIAELKTTGGKTRLEGQKLKLRIQHLEKDLKKQEELVEQLRIEGEAFSKSEAKVKDSLRTVLQEKTLVESAVHELKRKLDSAVNESTELKKTIEDQKTVSSKVDPLLREQESSKIEIANLKSQVETLTAQVAEKDKEIKFITTKAKELIDDSKELSQLKSEKKVISDEYARFKETNVTIQLSLKKEIADMKLMVNQAADSERWKEENLKSENDMLQKRIDSLEESLQALTSQGMYQQSNQNRDNEWMSKYTALENTISEERTEWERTKSILNTKINNLEDATQMAKELETRGATKIKEMESKMEEKDKLISTYNNKISELEKTITEFKNQTEKLTHEVGILGKENKKLHAEVSQQKATLGKSVNSESVSAAERQLEDLQRELSATQEKVENLTSENTDLQQKLSAKEETQQIPTLVEQGPSATRENAEGGSPRKNAKIFVDTQSLSDMRPPLNRANSDERTAGPLTSQVSSAILSTRGSVAGNTAASMRRYESFIASLQDQLEAEATAKNEVISSLTQLTSQNKELQRKVDAVANIEKDHKILTERYNSVLELLGEKTEKVQELTQDISEMKEIFHAQLQSLMNQLAKK